MMTLSGVAFSSLGGQTASWYKTVGEDVPIANFAVYAKEKLKALTEQVFLFKPDIHEMSKAEAEKKRLMQEIQQCNKTLKM